MTTAYLWRCACGLEGKGEAAAQRHVNDDGCMLMGRPWMNPDYPRPA